VVWQLPVWEPPGTSPSSEPGESAL
jgi:hypothetical protein